MRFPPNPCPTLPLLVPTPRARFRLLFAGKSACPVYAFIPVEFRVGGGSWPGLVNWRLNPIRRRFFPRASAGEARPFVFPSL